MTTARRGRLGTIDGFARTDATSEKGHRLDPAEAPAAVAADPPVATPRLGRGPLAVAIAALAWLVLTAGLRPLALPDEGRYVGIGRAMLASGDWLTPTLAGLPYFHKPPLFYWITAASMAVFGENETAARAAPIVGAWMGAFALYLFARRWRDDATARRALVALLSMPLVFGGAQYANMDMLVAGCITATILLLAHVSQCLAAGQRAPRGVLVAAYAAAALGVLAKGLIGAALPILVVVAWLLVARRPRHIVAMLSPAGLGVFALLVLPWFVALQMRYPGFLDYFFVVQQVQRFAATGYNNARPFWFYVAMLAVASLAWLPWFARRAPAGPLRTLMLVWPVVVTVFFSVPQSKIPGYIFPALPPLAWLLAEALAASGAPTRRAQRLWAASAGVSAAIGLAVVVGLALHPIRSTRTLGLALAHEAAPAASVYFLHDAFFDIPFYAGLRAPVAIVDDWDTPAVRERDNWRKELADAADFTHRGRGDGPLVTPAELPGRLCGGTGRHWLVGANDAAARYAFLRDARVVATTREATLWRLDAARPAVAASLRCGR